MSSKPVQDAHIFVLVHGLWGGPNHMLTIEKSIKELLDSDDSSKEKIVTIRPSSFRFWKTYDGLQLNAERVVSDVLYEIEMLKSENNIKVTKISFVGYSLGGLISRYAIGILNEIGFFDKVQPMIFSTFATPHVGVHFFQQNAFDILANELGKYLFGKSGNEMFMGDDELILKKMADPEHKFYKGLKRFKKHILLANVKNDRTVAFFTSYITDYSPFEEWDKVKIKYFKDLPQVRIGTSQVKPKFVDFERSHPLEKENEFSNVQEETSFLRSNKLIRFTLIFIVTILILPIWVPLVLSSSLFASIYSGVKIKIIKSPKVSKHWERVSSFVYGSCKIDAEDAKIGQDKRNQRKNLRHHESFKGDTSEITENAMENFMYAEERFTGRSPPPMTTGDDEFPGDDDDDEDDDEEDETITNNVTDLKVKNTNDVQKAKPKQKIIDVDIEANGKSIDTHLSKLYNKDYQKFPLFTKDGILKMDPNRRFIIDSLNELNWIKIPVYIDAWNAHDGIVARRGPRTNPKGTATILLWATLLRRFLQEE
ncbi:lipid droplet phospholipase 1 [[Candida] anglica]|uniref:Lipid droplet phospholipase 1 n=1 Tax=[Candida] anglica TaxID=148631 RepID=A0ABP0E6E0_9ASCO